MSERHDRLAQISGELKRYIDDFCPASADGANDFLGEKCNDAFLMLQAALKDLEEND